VQCPACNKESDPAEYGDPAKCPACGVFYEKALALKQRRITAEAAAKEAAKPKPSGTSQPADDWNGAKVSVGDGTRQRSAEQQRNIATRATLVAQPVVVVDISMSFWSMVIFMVKWVVASIPAAIILALLLAAIGGAGYTLFSAVSGYFTYKERFDALSAAAATPVGEPIRVPVSGDVKYFEIGLAQSDNFAVITVDTVSASGFHGYSRMSVNCEAASAVVTAQAPTIEALSGYEMPPNYQPIFEGTPRHYIAIKACSGMPRTHQSLR